MIKPMEQKSTAAGHAGQSLRALVRAARPSAVRTVLRDVTMLRTCLANCYFVADRTRDSSPWVLVDTGMPGYAHRIRHAARGWGEGQPEAIILTHGHFDHVGGVKRLAEEWGVPVYAHERELPYLTGLAEYPAPDPTVGGGLLAQAARLMPRQGVDLRGFVRALPEDGKVPGLPEWRWIATPGHTPGHVSLFRELDGVLIAGDAFVTTRQESLAAVLTQRKELNGPPAYFTPDWVSAKRSVQELADLKPSLALTGHGPPMSGTELRRELDRLALHFEFFAVPRHGRYVPTPAFVDNTRGCKFPSRRHRQLARYALPAAALLLVAGLGARQLRKRRTS
jgi:glyoxylase-like metal-dependent hydrolase (beta-lactamase superfamily II)